MTSRTRATAGPPRRLAAWRSDGTLHKDPHPSIYVYEQAYRVPGSDVARTQRGFFARLRLESFGTDGGRLPHERTMAGPREDRYKLLRATGVNTSPIVGLYDDAAGVGARRARHPDGAARGPRRHRRRRHRASTVGGGGGRRRCRGRGTAPGRGGGGPADHRRRPSPLRDGPPLPRRAADVPIVRGGSRLRLRADALPRRRRAGADRAADAPGGPRVGRRRRRGDARPPR